MHRARAVSPVPRESKRALQPWEPLALPNQPATSLKHGSERLSFSADQTIFARITSFGCKLEFTHGAAATPERPREKGLTRLQRHLSRSG